MQFFVLVTILSNMPILYLLQYNVAYSMFFYVLCCFHNPPVSLTSASNFTSTLSLWHHSLLTSSPHPLFHITPPLLFLNWLSLLPLSLFCNCLSNTPLLLHNSYHPSFSPCVSSYITRSLILQTPPPPHPTPPHTQYLSLSFSPVLAASCNIMWAECQVLPSEQTDYV